MNASKSIQKKDILSNLFAKRYNEKIESINSLPISGSSRSYFKISSKNRTVIGTFNSDVTENQAFFMLTEHFLKQSLAVPKIFAVSDEQNAYLQEYLGEDTLYAYIGKTGESDNFESNLLSVYKRVLDQLILLQTKNVEQIDFSACYPRANFDEQSIAWDLNYFKYMFLKPAHIPFDEQKLEIDFTAFNRFIQQADSDYFLFRDFQSRNIMFNKGNLSFIDYQGGRKGALQYDLASLLYDAKAKLSNKLRAELTEYYTELVTTHTNLSKADFLKYYKHFIILRILQAMGAYGYRGIVEGKKHFLLSINPAVENISSLLKDAAFLSEFPELRKVLISLSKSEALKNRSKKAELKVTISSFSYKRAIPYDKSGNGGGFVFDCRFLHNPGRYKHYKKLTGKDSKVIDFLKHNSKADEFANQCFEMIKPAIINYSQRQFTNLNISFGCTGGQHRSVYLADELYKKISAEFMVQTEIFHHEQNF